MDFGAAPNFGSLFSKPPTKKVSSSNKLNTGKKKKKIAPKDEFTSKSNEEPREQKKKLSKATNEDMETIQEKKQRTSSESSKKEKKAAKRERETIASTEEKSAEKKAKTASIPIPELSAEAKAEIEKEKRNALDISIAKKLEELQKESAEQKEKKKKEQSILNLNSSKKPIKKSKKKEQEVEVSTSSDNEEIVMNDDEDEDAEFEDDDNLRKSLLQFFQPGSLHYNGPESDVLDLSSSSSESEESVEPVPKRNPLIDKLASSTVMIGGLTQELSVPEVRGLLKECGRINDIRFVAPRNANTPTKVAFVDFAKKDGAYNALQLHKTVFHDRVLDISIAGQKTEKEKFMMFVKNVPFNATEEELAQVFEECGKIVSVHLPMADEYTLKGMSGHRIATFEFFFFHAPYSRRFWLH